MPDAEFYLPAVVKAGVIRKIRESFHTLVDGQPSSRGMPLETEVRYYYNFYLSHNCITFETFLSALSVEVSKHFPSVEFTLDWIQRCDKCSRINSARSSISKLRKYVHEGQKFRTGFWEILWTLTEIDIKKFALTYEEIKTTLFEIKSLSWYYLLSECKARVNDFKNLAKRKNTIYARDSFIILNDMIQGKPIPFGEFCKKNGKYSSPSGAYKLYSSLAEGRVICPEDVGWSAAAVQGYEALFFPEGLPENITAERDPISTMPTIAELDKQTIPHRIPLERTTTFQTASVTEQTTPWKGASPWRWSQGVQSISRQLSLMRRQAQTGIASIMYDRSPIKIFDGTESNTSWAVPLSLAAI